MRGTLRATLRKIPADCSAEYSLGGGRGGERRSGRWLRRHRTRRGVAWGAPAELIHREFTEACAGELIRLCAHVVSSRASKRGPLSPPPFGLPSLLFGCPLPPVAACRSPSYW